MQFRCTSA